jgi:branched-chain amino acid transport system ATP-binding protein
MNAAMRGTAAGPMALELSGVTVRFGGLQALSDVSLRVEPGEIVGLIGPNGAGKTTLLGAVSGLVRCQAGRVFFDRRDVTRLAPWRRAGLGVVRTFQHAGLVPEATVLANLVMAQHAAMDSGSVRGVLGLASGEERELVARSVAALDRIGAAEVADVRVAHLSHGLRKLVEVAAALARRPRLVLLDEPSAGLDSAETTDLATRLAAAQAEAGFSVLVIDHDLRFVRHLVQRLVVLAGGAVLATGSWDQVRADPAVVAAYLGSAPADSDAGVRGASLEGSNV